MPPLRQFQNPPKGLTRSRLGTVVLRMPQGSVMQQLYRYQKCSRTVFGSATQISWTKPAEASIFMQCQTFGRANIRNDDPDGAVGLGWSASTACSIIR